MDEQQQIFGLMAVAEEHQKAVTAAIAGLAAERAALAKERALLAQVAQGIQKAAGDGPVRSSGTENRVKRPI